MRRISERPDRFEQRLAWGLVSLAIAVTSLARWRLLDVPLERDEGEYAYLGSLLLRGVPPWEQAWNMKLPGVYALYAAFIGIGGPSAASIHAGLLVSSAISALLCFWIGRRLFGAQAGAAAGVAYAALATSPALLGFAAHAEAFSVAFALAGLALLLRALDARSALACFASGLLLGAALVVKQNSAPFALFSSAWIAGAALRAGQDERARMSRCAAAHVAGVLAPLLATLVALQLAGVFERFWFWTTTYAFWYGTRFPVTAGVRNLARALRMLLPSQIAFWIAAALGLSSAAWRPATRTGMLFCAGILAAGIAGASAGLAYRRQYFVLTLPGVALCGGAGVAWAADLAARAGARSRALVAAALALAGFTTALAAHRELLFRATPLEVSRAVYGANPFPESLEIALEIARRTDPSATIAVIGSEPQIYFYAGRPAATGYIYTYALMELHPYAAQMQEEMIREIEAAQPEILVFVKVDTSWLVRPTSSQRIFDWLDDYAARHYERVGIADIFPAGSAAQVWGDEAPSYQPRSPYWVSILQRKR